MSADLAIVGVRVRTMDPELPRASAVAIRDGVIVTVGDDAEVRRECAASTRLVDGSGLVLTPGLTDGHQHLVMGAEVAQGVDFDRVDSLDGVRSKLRGRRAEVGMVRPGFRADLVGWGDDPVTCPAADVTDLPVRLTILDGQVVHHDAG